MNSLIREKDYILIGALKETRIIGTILRNGLLRISKINREEYNQVLNLITEWDDKLYKMLDGRISTEEAK
jgi:pyrroloquinoline quinone (PQQ) biosynthesis protein C